jgi:surface antigen
MKRAVAAIAIATAFLTLSAANQAHAMNCVAYAQQQTGFDLRGDAWRWWDSASGEYARGHAPETGAVLVFDRTKKMRHGHVAIVRSVKTNREILIDHANWGHGKGEKGKVTKAVSVIDVSPNNDWSQVRVRWGNSVDYGRVNPVRGFIYPDEDTKKG